MFKRNKPGENGGMETPRDAGPLLGAAPLPAGKPVPPPGAGDSADKPAPSAAKPIPTPPVRSGFDMPRRVVDIPPAARRSEPSAAPTERKKLIVGREISLNGKISSCDRLVVEGRVEAELHDCHTIEIAETGTFKGAAEIESAEVSGKYEGSLTVRDHLLIRGTGHVSGTVRYGRLEIEDGGEINGDVRSLKSHEERKSRGEAQAGNPSGQGASAERR